MCLSKRQAKGFCKSISYRALLLVNFVNVGGSNEALKLEEMRQRGILPGTSTTNNIINGFCGQNEVSY